MELNCQLDPFSMEKAFLASCKAISMDMSDEKMDPILDSLIMYYFPTLNEFDFARLAFSYIAS